MTGSISVNDDVRIVLSTDPEYAHFFGYYDKSPVDAAGRFLLTHRVSFDGRDFAADDEAQIGYYGLSDGRYRRLTTSKALNWQQGSHLQWLGPDFGRRLVFNDRRDDQFVSVVLDIETGQERILPFPVYAVHPAGEFAVGVNYEHFAFCRPGYDYRGVRNAEWDRPLHPEDGLFRVDLINGDVRRLVATADLVRSRRTQAEMADSYHWLEHVHWNPSGTRFLFMHRWAPRGKGHRTRIYTADATGTNIHGFPDVGFYSHAEWKDDETFSIWSRRPTRRARFRFAMQPWKERVGNLGYVRRLYRAAKRGAATHRSNKDNEGQAVSTYRYAGDGSDHAFVLWNDVQRTHDVIDPALIHHDGHCSWTRDGRFMLFDTYEDEESRRHLFLYDHAQSRVIALGSFLSLYNAAGYRCDLHPRFSRDENLVCVDSAHEKKRQQVVLDITEMWGQLRQT